ncbi:hypothetical protein AB205_0189400 [Aquarana catesbeiana]|uniref:Uncharacterized protein n=1 Tax=Aquarana catesbeiana TaxID=8400 RepID=A0A2G9SEN9_AQUCT|nr:hypothetical protein AB205_0189400 [Aquarana catesbeiana]
MDFRKVACPGCKNEDRPTPQKLCCTLVITGLLNERHQSSLRRINLTTVPPPDDTYGDASECNTSMEGDLRFRPSRPILETH